jgi:hypothetical protein
MTHTPDDDLARLSEGELLGRLCGTNGPTLSLLDLLWRNAAARPGGIEAKQPELGFLLSCAVDVIRDVALGQVGLMNPLGVRECRRASFSSAPTSRPTT